MLKLKLEVKCLFMMPFNLDLIPCSLKLELVYVLMKTVTSKIFIIHLRAKVSFSSFQFKVRMVVAFDQVQLIFSRSSFIVLSLSKLVPETFIVVKMD